jgi:ABC-type Fe3+-hydroxamate transport system substrate-binding protein
MLNSLRTLVQLDAADKIVATSTVAGFIYDDPGRSKYFSPLHRAAPELGELPRIDYRDPSLEVILTLKPDVILSYGAYSDPDAIQEGTGISTICSGKSAGGDLSFREKEAEELISYVNEKLDELRDVTSEMSDSEKPKVLVVHLGGGGATPDITSVMVRYDPVEIAGGINVAEECIGESVVVVSKEYIIAWNPDIVLMGSSPSKEHSYSIDEFADLDVEEECNEILERFYGVDGLYTEMVEKCDLYRWKEGENIQDVGSRKHRNEQWDTKAIWEYEKFVWRSFFYFLLHL